MRAEALAAMPTVLHGLAKLALAGEHSRTSLVGLRDWFQVPPAALAAFRLTACDNTQFVDGTCVDPTHLVGCAKVQAALRVWKGMTE